MSVDFQIGDVVRVKDEFFQYMDPACNFDCLKETGVVVCVRHRYDISQEVEISFIGGARKLFWSFDIEHASGR